MYIALGIVAAALVLFLLFVATRPSAYVISREIAINATVEKVFPYLNNSLLADQWMPWKEFDPQTVMSFSGPAEGVGAKSSWVGKQMGVGSATISSSEPNARVGIDLVYEKPMAMKQFAEYLVRAEGSGSVVTWRVSGNNTFVGRFFCVFMNMDKMVGGNFEKGLANLKRVLE